AGAATFTATADGVTSVPYTVTVTDQKVTGIVISGSNTVQQGGTLALSASVTPGTAVDKNVTWSLVSGSELATISASGTVTANAFGNLTVRATANDGSGKYADKNILITAPAGSPVSWAGKSWWVIDSDGSQFGGGSGSVVLLLNDNSIGNMPYHTASNDPGYKNSSVRNYLVGTSFLSSAYQAKLSPHSKVGDKVWLASSYEVWGSSRGSNYADPYEIARQFSYFSSQNVSTPSNSAQVQAKFGNVSAWLRSPSTVQPKDHVHVYYGTGQLGTDKCTVSYAIRPCVILNP
ncbi:Ig-like domain-containing protein, partial [Harryflintia acetispora]|uniref:Ig-like domain-containing protein n=1 Tax=Harryflintia acetispora TaxID=1849041 RepID=UPI001896D995